MKGKKIIKVLVYGLIWLTQFIVERWLKPKTTEKGKEDNGEGKTGKVETGIPSPMPLLSPNQFMMPNFGSGEYHPRKHKSYCAQKREARKRRKVK